MKQSESLSASKKTAQLKREFRVDVIPDWGRAGSRWRQGTWSLSELEKLQQAIRLMAESMGGQAGFIQGLGGVTVRKSELGLHGGEALGHKVSLSANGPFSMWTVVHEMAHAWDANHDWKLSIALEKYSGGFTNFTLSRLLKLLGVWDAGPRGEENRAGRHGRRRGCNQAGYFYGDKPSGSNWNFNRKEDFAESVAMYLGWSKANDLSPWAENRLNRFLLPNGAADAHFGADNWADYKKFFYPEGGDYSNTKRWKFVNELMLGRR